MAVENINKQEEQEAPRTKEHEHTDVPVTFDWPGICLTPTLWDPLHFDPLGIFGGASWFSSVPVQLPDDWEPLDPETDRKITLIFELFVLILLLGLLALIVAKELGWLNLS